MRRSISVCEPNLVKAGEVGTWKFLYTTANNLEKGARLRFDIGSTGRAIDWQSPEVDLKKGKNLIYAVLDNGKILAAKEVEVPGKVIPAYEFVLPNEIAAGKVVTIVLGAPKTAKGKDLEKLGNKAQANAQRRHPFLLSVAPTPKAQFQEPEVFSMDIRGTKLHSIKIITPSFVIKNRRFDIIVRFEDEFGNLTNETEEKTLIELSHEHLRESLNWKLFVPETGFITLPNLYFNEPGIYTIQLKNLKSKEVFKSSPVKCFSEQADAAALFWGVTHGESERVDSTENIESCLRHFRDERAMNFFASSPFENQEETPNEVWKQITQSLIEFNEEDRFTTFMGFQWVGEPKEEGLRQVIFAKENKTLPRKKDPKYGSLKKLYKSFSPKEIVSIPSFTMAKGFEYDFNNFEPDFERVVEIYNAWGSSENSAKEGNPIPIRAEGKKGIQESNEGSIQKALQRNLRFGFVAGGLDDRGIYADFYGSGQNQYPPGLTAIIAKAHNREAIFEALYNRSCYATTGERIILGLYVAGVSMGQVVNSGTKHGLLINRHISGFVAGTANLSSVEIIRNGQTIHTIKPKPANYSIDFTYDDMDPLEKVVIKPKDKAPPFIYYYLRVTQEDGHMAWSSPIWVDLVPPLPREPRKIPKPAPKKIEEDLGEEEDEDEDYF
jgi:hypothetical protein